MRQFSLNNLIKLCNFVKEKKLWLKSKDCPTKRRKKCKEYMKEDVKIKDRKMLRIDTEKCRK